MVVVEKVVSDARELANDPMEFSYLMAGNFATSDEAPNRRKSGGAWFQDDQHRPPRATAVLVDDIQVRVRTSLSLSVSCARTSVWSVI
jgi:hypothetical protein